MSKRAAIAAHPTAAVTDADAVGDKGAIASADPSPGTDAACLAASVCQRHQFPALDALVLTASAPAIAFGPFLSSLGKALTELAGVPCRIAAGADAAPDDAAAEETVWYAALDGSVLGVALSTTLAEALVSLRCGGALASDAGRLRGTASVLRLQATLVTIILRTAAASWLAVENEWAPASAAPTPLVLVPLQAWTISAGDLDCPLGIAVHIAGPVTGPEPPLDRVHDLRRAIERLAFPVRAVLFETQLPLTKAAQLRPGDVLPIEAPRDVGLRIGAHRLASGTIAPSDDGGHVVTIRAGARSLLQPHSEKAPL